MASFNNHQYPLSFLKFPILLRLSHYLDLIFTLRLWYISKFTTKQISKFNSKFRMLDIGCGSGAILFDLRKKFRNGDYRGIDKAESNVATANNYLKYKHISNISFKVGDAAIIDGGGAYDIISLFSVLIYIEDDIEALRNIHKCLSDDGILLLFVSINHRRIFPFFDKWINKYFQGTDYNVHNPVYHKYNSNSIVENLHIAGFQKINKTETVGNFGRLAYELYTLLFYSIVKFNWPIKILLSIIFIFYIPFHITLMLFDFLSATKSGNSCFIVAQK